MKTETGVIKVFNIKEILKENEQETIRFVYS
jgi:hypothetical protein